MSKIMEKYQSEIIKRYDDDGIIKYYHYSEFPGLTAKQILFSTPHGERIIGYIYTGHEVNQQPLVVLSHGLGGGHRSYMREIVKLCEEGYRVVAYDNTGCFESGGESILGITESVCVLNACLDWLGTQNEFKNLPIILFGHSQGAYAVLTSLRFHKGTAKCIALSCFNSMEDFLTGYMQLSNENDRNEILSFERRLHPDIADLRLTDILQNTDVPTLLIHSEDDFLVPPAYGTGKIQSMTDNSHLRFLFVNNKKHLPHYTEAGTNLLYTTFADYAQKVTNGELKTKEEMKNYMQKVDFYKMTEQDDRVWKTIFDFMSENNI